LMAASLSGILAQRLLRKFCKCRVQTPARPEFLARMAAVSGGDCPDREYQAVGCSACEGTGFRGRVGVYEMLSIDEPVRAAIRGGGIDVIQDAARAQGMKLMQEDALDKVRAGITTLDEVLRVVAFESAPTVKCPACGQPQTSAFRFCPHCGAARENQSGGPSVAQSGRQGVLVR